MTPRERFNSEMRFVVTDKIPSSIHGLTPAVSDLFKEKTGSDDAPLFFGDEIRIVPRVDPGNTADFSEYYDAETLARATVGSFGIAQVPGRTGHFRHRVSPLDKDGITASDIDAYPFPDYGTPDIYRLAPSHVIEPEVPWENLLAFKEGVNTYCYRKRRSYV